MTTPNKEASVEEIVKKFGNDMAFKLPVSNDTMEAVRLVRKMLPELLQTQEARVREEERNRIKNECHYCQGMGTVRESVEQDNGTGAIEQFDCSLCKGKGFITPTINKDKK